MYQLNTLAIGVPCVFIYLGYDLSFTKLKAKIEMINSFSFVINK